MVNWNDNKKRIDFREALQKAYPSDAELEIFVSDALDENLATIAGGDNLKVIVYNLVNWANKPPQDRLNKLYEAFKQENPKHPVIEKIERSSFVSQTCNLTQNDWDTLFGQFLPDDLADLQRAFRQGFEQALKLAFQRARPEHSPLTELTQIRELLELYDADENGPVLAVRFVECAIEEFQRSSGGNDRNLMPLEQWRDRIAQQYKVSPVTPEPDQKIVCRQGYLLVAFEESGSNVIVYPELRVTGESKPIEFDVSCVQCNFREVAGYLSDWIYLAEKALDGKHDSNEIVLELFLPCKLLEEDIATWEVKDHREQPISLGMYRRFVVRSLDRIKGNNVKQIENVKAIKKLLEHKWQLLKEGMKDRSACDKFHLEEKYLQIGRLGVLLKRDNVVGLKLVAEFPLERDKRETLLYEIIDSGVPIALWSPSVVDKAILAELKTQMNNLSRESHLTNFADLAQRWREKLAQSENESVKHIRLLCDCPDRLPNLPNPDQEEDLLVA